jgi:hypothetical protein
VARPSLVLGRRRRISGSLTIVNYRNFRGEPPRSLGVLRMAAGQAKEKCHLPFPNMEFRLSTPFRKFGNVFGTPLLAVAAQ